MGKRKRRSAPSGDARPAARAAENDVDADCVHYQSSSEDSGNGVARLMMQYHSNVLALGSDSDLASHSDMEPHDEAHSEFMRSIELSRSKSDESDVELSVEFFDPRERDAGAIGMLLRKYCKACTAVGKGKEQATSAGALARAVCAQTRVGTTIRLSDEEAPIGFISCLNVREHAKVLRDVKRKLVEVAERQRNDRFIALLNKCMEGAGRFDSERMGLVLCERVVNMPTEVVAKMLEALSCEVEWATEDEPTQRERDAFKFGWYLYIAEVYCYKEGEEEEEDGEDGEAEGKKKKKRARVESKAAEERLAFGRVEDSEWHKHASCSVSWDWGGAEEGVKQRRMAMVVAAKKLAAIRHAVERRTSGGGGGGDDDNKEEENA